MERSKTHASASRRRRCPRVRTDLDFEGDMPTGWTVLDAVVVAKCLDEDGRVALLNRATDGLSS